MREKKQSETKTTIGDLVKRLSKSLQLLSLLFMFQACQEPFEPDFTDEEPTVVIEGYIQAGEGAAPVLVSIGKTYPLFQSGEVQGPELFLGGAKVRVEGNGKTVILTEVCTDNLTEEQLELVGQLTGIDSLFLSFGICFYVDLAGEIEAVVGEKYRLIIDFEEDVLTAETSIPTFVPIDSFNIFTSGIDPQYVADYRSLNGYLQDPLGLHFYRLKVSINGSPYRNDFSVTDDVLFDGQDFEFPINNQPDPSQDDFNPDVAGLFAVGDTIGVQWQTLDESHYNFWNTLEFARANGGPFASYTRAETNINGGIGVWGGSSIGYYSIIIE